MSGSLREAITPEALQRTLDRWVRQDPMAAQVDAAMVCRRVAQGRWAPGRLRIRRRRKSDGSYREIRVPPAADRALQALAHAWLAPRVDGVFVDAVHGYRPGRSVGTALDALIGAPPSPCLELVATDVRGLFDRLRHDELGAVVDAWATEPGRGVPQGAPLSPLLANLYLARTFDPHDAGPEVARWVRYADDVTWRVHTAGGAATTLVRAIRALHEAGLEVAPGKTKVAIAGVDDGAEVLGRARLRGLAGRAAGVGPRAGGGGVMSDGGVRRVRWVEARW